jgi:hypothetical protein
MKEIFERLFTFDDRAVAPVLGVALLFAIAAIALSAWQTTVIPQQNKEVEFDHYGDVQGDLEDLRSAHLQAVSTGQSQAPTIELGASYRSRMVGVNPPDPVGTLETEELQGRYEIRNAPSMTSGEAVTTTDVCGTANPKTDAVRYDPSYNRLSDDETPPIVYENTVLYREGLVGTPDSNQAIIQDSNIDIQPFHSQVQRSSPTTSLTLSSEGYQVEKDLKESATPVLLVPTDIPVETWRNKLLKPSGNEYVESVTTESNGNRIKIQLANLEPKTSNRWTVRCAITTTGETTTVPKNLDKSPLIKNGGFGRGGITEHTVDSNTDTVTLPNGKWIEIASISQLNFLGADEPVGVTGNDLNGGDGIAVEYKISDGRSDEVVYVKVAVTKGSDGWQDKVVMMGNSPNNYQDGPTLTDQAANKILENGDINVLDPANYEAATFDTQEGNFGAYVREVRKMEDATIQTTDLQGRIDMEVLTGDLTLDVQDDDERQSYVKGDTSRITFDVTATGTTDAPENVDLKVSKSGSDGLTESPRSDRVTVSGLDDDTESFTLTWEIDDWNNLDSGTYDVLIESENDQAFATVDIIDRGNENFVVEIVDTDAPVEYREPLTADVKVTNNGDSAGQAQPQLSVAGSSGPQDQFNLPPGESKTVTMEYDTADVDTDNLDQEVQMKATTDDDVDKRSVVIESPSVITEPDMEDVQAGGSGLDQTMEFTLGEDTDGATIVLDLGDTGSSVEYDLSDGNWVLVEGNGQLQAQENNGRTEVEYQTHQSRDNEGDTIEIRATNVNTEDADPGIYYDVEYELTSANNYPQGETNSTSFETTE